MSKVWTCWVLLPMSLAAAAWMGCTGVEASAERQVTIVEAVPLAPLQMDRIEADEAATTDQELAGCFCYGTWYTTATAACSSAELQRVRELPV